MSEKELKLQNELLQKQVEELRADNRKLREQLKELTDKAQEFKLQADINQAIRLANRWRN